MSSPANETQLLEEHEHEEHENDDKFKVQPTVTDPRLDCPRPPAWKRAALVALLAVLLSLAFYLGPFTKPAHKVIHASRYSKEFKYRPAASPVITERLKDGKVRLRGAHPTH